MVKTYTLKSGIPLFVVEMHNAPVVSIQAWVARGSAHEPAPLAGISHFIEHALFKGTKKRKVGQIALDIETWGGEVNAYTSFEETVYYTTLASRFFENGLDVIADAVQNATFDRVEMDREREVILEEIKRAYDSPSKMVFTNLWAKTFPGTPYGRPVLGFEKTVGGFSAATLKKYFQENYHAGTFSLFLVGDIDPQEAYELAEKKFAKVRKAPKSKAKEKPLSLASLSGQPMATLARDVQECHLQIGFRSPALRDPSVAALDLLATAVGQGESSRFYQRLVKETRLAMDADMGIVATDRCGVATLSLLTAPDKLYEAVAEMMKILAEVAAEGLHAEELDRVKSGMESEIFYGKQTVEGYARRLGYYNLHFKDPEFEKTYLEMISECTGADVQLAFQALMKAKPVVSIVHPQKFELDKKQLWGAIKLPKVQVTKSRVTLDPPQKKVVEKCSFIWKRNNTLPLTSLRFIFLGGGSREEQTHNLGISSLFSTLWTSGTQNYTSLAMAKILESLGASVGAFAGKNTCGLSVDFVSHHWNRIKPILSDILYNPTFPEEEFKTQRDITLREIESINDSPGQMCQLNFLSAMYENHRFGFPSIGTKEAVGGLSTDVLKQWYRDYIHKERLVISTVGAFAPQDWMEELQSLVAPLRPRGKASLPAADISAPSQIRIRSAVKTPLFQAHALIGFLGTTLNDEDRFALRVLSSCLSGQGGRLFLELRDKQSLAYTVAPMESESIERGTFAFYIGTSPEKWQRSITGIRAELDKVLNKPMSAKELARAKQYLVGRFELDLQRNSSQAMLYGLDETYGYGHLHSLEYPKKIQEVTAETILRVAQKYLQPQQAVISLVHPEQISEEAIYSAWTGNAKRSQSRPQQDLEASGAA